MKNKTLKIQFSDAVAVARDAQQPLPPDIKLMLYAYYKQATQENHIVPFHLLAENDLRGAFKYNAMIQVKGLSINEAMKAYIELVNEYLKK